MEVYVSLDEKSTAMKGWTVTRGQIDYCVGHWKAVEGKRSLDLHGSQVSDAGLAHLEGCTGLSYLGLGGTRVSDAGLTRFENYETLTFLGLQKTKVTAAKVEELKKALPRCNIYWDER